MKTILILLLLSAPCFASDISLGPSVSNPPSGYLPLTGGTLSGFLGLGINPTSQLDVEDTNTTTSSATNYNIKNKYTLNPASNTSYQSDGIYNNLMTSSSGSVNYFLLKDDYNELDHNGTGTVQYATAIGGSVLNNSGGIIQNAYADYLGVYNSNGSHINSGFGLFVDTPSSNGGSGSMDVWYGGYIHGDSNATNSYALYASGGKNYFSGNVGIGTAPTAFPLTISGNLSLTSTAPTISTCGGGTLVTGSSNNKGEVSGIIGATACTITFSSALPAGPACVFSTNISTLAPYPSAISTTAVTAALSSFTGTLYYICL